MKRFGFVVVFVIAFAAFAIHAFCLGIPNITLIFDAPGFLFAANGCLSAFNPDTIARCIVYVFHGLPATERLQLASSLAPAADLVKHGPLVPLFLAAVYKTAGLAAISANWRTGALAMMGCLSLMVALLWLIARRYFGRNEAILAVAFCLLYPGFLLNVPRLYSETPAALAIVFLAWAALRLMDAFDEQSRKNATIYGAAVGLASGLVILSRATFLFLPIVLFGTLALVKRESLRGQESKRAMVACAIVLLAMLAPWVVFKQIMTGKPSLVIERHAAYNLYAGSSVKNDGYDVLPSVYVAHPEQFKGQTSEAIANVVKEAREKPFEFIGLMLRKPARLIDAPWNDFQQPVWGAPWVVQTAFHQLLLLLATAGCWFGFTSASFTPVQRRVIAIISLIAGYHLVYCLFITMPRYSFTAMPEVILLAAVGATFAYKNLIGQEKASFFAITLLVPLLAAALWCLHSGNLPGLQAAVLAAMLAGWFVILLKRTPRSFAERSLFVFAVISVLSCFLSTNATVALADQNASATTLSFQPHTSVLSGQSSRVFLMMDVRTDSIAPTTVTVKHLDRQIAAPLFPSFAWDASQRESMLYQRIFAEASATNPQSFKQWWLAELPLDFADGNALNISLEPQQNWQLGNGPELDAARYSWTKGFMVDWPGEMRMPQSSHKGPRLQLLVVHEPSVHVRDQATEDQLMAVPAAEITTAPSKRLVEMRAFPDTIRSHVAKFGSNSDVKITVSGELRGETKACPSIALVESIETPSGGQQELAPLAPHKIPAVDEWRSFEFSDLIPLASADSPRRLDGLRITIFGAPWFDALQYAQFRPRGAFELRNVRVTAQPIKLINLQRSRWQVVHGSTN